MKSTTKRRLEALESTSGLNAITDHAETIVSLLGWVDSLFWPARDSAAGKLASVKNVRSQYLNVGTAWSGSSGGGSSRAWKSDHRLRESLASAGLITLTRSKSNLPLVKMNPAAEHAVRLMVGLPTLADIFPLLIRLRLEQGATETGIESGYRKDGWRSEEWLFSSNYEENPKIGDWETKTEMMLPLLVAGVVESKPSTVNQVYYRLTGVEAVVEPHCIDVPSDRDLRNRGEESLHRVYIDSFDAGLTSREMLKTTNEIAIRLPATR